MVKVDVISGFLGAGKTTLIKKLFSARMGKERIALIENEFGEIGIDGSFLKESGVRIKEINSGCICCSLVGNFEQSLKEIIDAYSPDRIIIEPSGVGKLSDIVSAITNTGLDLKINVLCTVVDGGKCGMYLKNFGEFYIDQVSKANVIVVSKTEKLSEAKISSTVELIKKYNSEATFITTPLNEIDEELLIKNLEGNSSLVSELLDEIARDKKSHHDEEECGCGHHHHDHDDEECGCGHHHHHDEEECGCGHHHHDHDEEECGCGHHHHGHDADEVFSSWGTETPVSYSKEELNGILSALCGSAFGMILRAKGIVRASDNDGWYHFDLVAGEYEIRIGCADVTGKVCVIGSGLDKAGVEKLFIKR